MIRKIFALLALVGLAAAPMAGWAASATYDGTLEVKTWSQGGGTVSASQNTTAGEYGETENSHYQQTDTTSLSHWTVDASRDFTFYAFAQPAEGYKFAGWFMSDACEGSPESDSASGYKVTFSVDKNSSDTKTIYAKFVSADSKVDINDTEITLNPLSANYTGSEQTTTVTVKYGSTTLNAGADYTVSGDSLTQMGSALSNETYKVIINAVDGSDYTGSATADWTIVAPSGSFATDALKTSTAGCAVDGSDKKIINVTDSTMLVYDTNLGGWKIEATVDVPYEKMNQSSRKYYTDAEVFATPAEGSGTAINETATQSSRTYVNDIKWTIVLTVADINEAKGNSKTELRYEMTAYALANSYYSNGLAPTTYTVVVPIDENLVLNDENGDEAYPNAHKHMWESFAASGDTFTANCTNRNTECSEDNAITLTLTVADYAYTGNAPTVSLDGKDDFDKYGNLKSRVSYGTFAYIKPAYSQGNDQWYTGDYTAVVTVTVDSVDYELTKAFKIKEPDGGYTSGYELRTGGYNVSFKTIGDAVAAAADGDTIKCCANDTSFKGFTANVAEGKTVTIDLNGKMLSSSSKTAMTLTNTGTGVVRLTNGTIKQPKSTSSTGYEHIDVTAGKFVFDDGLVLDSQSEDAHYVDIYNFHVNVSGSGTQLAVSNGQYQAIFTGDVKISGGQFWANFDPTSMLADGYIARELTEGDYKYEVIERPSTVDLKDAVFSLSEDSYDFDGTTKSVTETVSYGGDTLDRGTHYTITEDMLSGAGSAESNTIYTVIITAIAESGYTGSATNKWTIVAPTGSFAADALSAGAGCTASGNAATVTESTKLEYVAENTWQVSAEIKFPRDFPNSIITGDTSKYIGVDQVLIGADKDGETKLETDVKEYKALGSVVASHTYADYLTWKVQIPLSDITSAIERGENQLDYTITVGALAWDRYTTGLKPTTYTLTVPIDENLKLFDENNQVYPELSYIANIGAKKFLNLADALGSELATAGVTVEVFAGAAAEGKVVVPVGVTLNLGSHGNAGTSYVLTGAELDASAKVISSKDDENVSATGVKDGFFKVAKTEDSGIYTYALEPNHEHMWGNFELADNVLTATCTNGASCTYGDGTVSITLNAEGKVWDDDNSAVTPTLSGREAFEQLLTDGEHTVTVDEVTVDHPAYSKGKWLTGAYTAKCTVTIDGVDYELKKAFEITKPEGGYTSGFEAQIDGYVVRFGSLSEAANSVPENSVITLRYDGWNAASFTATASQNITLDLNGKTLTYAKGKGSGNTVTDFTIQNIGAGTVTLINGTIKQPVGYKYNSDSSKETKQIVTSGNFAFGQNLVVLKDNDTTVTATNGKLSVKDGVYQAAFEQGEGGTVEITGGSFLYDDHCKPTLIPAGYVRITTPVEGGNVYQVIAHVHKMVTDIIGENTLSNYCAEGGCDDATGKWATLSVTTPAEYTGKAFGVQKTGDLAVMLTYFNGEAQLEGAPTAAGNDYKVVMSYNDKAITNGFEITAANLENVTFALDAESYDFSGKANANSIKTAKLGDYNLQENKDYVVSGDSLTQVGSASSNCNYAVTLTGIGNFTGTKELSWTIKAPSGSFAADALSTTAAGCTASGNAVTVTDSTKLEYVAENTWRASAVIKFPVDLPDTSATQNDPDVKYIDEAHALISTEHGEYRLDIQQKEYKIPVIGTVLGHHDYINTLTWTVDIPLADITDAIAAGKTQLDYTNTVGALAWTHYTSGLKPTAYTLTIPLEGIVLNGADGNQVYPHVDFVAQIGTKKYDSLTNALSTAALDATETNTNKVELTAEPVIAPYEIGAYVWLAIGEYGLDSSYTLKGGAILTAAAEPASVSAASGNDLVKTGDGPFTYTTIKSHEHAFGNFTLKGAELTAFCTNKLNSGAACAETCMITLTAESVEYGTAPSATCVDKFDKSITHTVGTVGYIRPAYSATKWYTGDYTAVVTVTVDSVEYELKKGFSITKPQGGYTTGYVSSSNDVSFASIGEALKYAVVDDVIVVLSPFDAAGKDGQQEYDFTSAKNLTIDLNGQLLTYIASQDLTIWNKDVGVVTLINGTIQQPKGDSIVSTAHDVLLRGDSAKKGSLVFEDGIVFKNVASSSSNYLTVTADDVSVIVSNGAYQAGFETKNSGSVSIAGGKFWAYDKPTALASDHIVREISGDFKYEVVEHHHAYSYGAVDNVITAVCDAVNHEFCGFNVQMLTLTAENAIETDSPYAGAKVETYPGFPVAAEDVTIVYYTKADQTTSLPGAPTGSGEYVAKVTVGGVTAEAEFQITHEHAFKFGVTDNVLTAGCTAAGLCDSRFLSVTLVAEDRDWQKETPFAASVTDDFGETIDHEVGEYVYYKRGEQEPLEGAPILTGEYTVKVTVTAPRTAEPSGETAAGREGAAGTVDYTLTKDFEITKPEDGYKAGFEVEGGLCYDTFEEALAATGEGETLCYHEELDNKATFEFTSAKSITIDLCDNELTYSQSKKAASDLTIVNNGDGVVTLKNGTIIQPTGQKQTDFIGLYFDDLYYNVNVVGKFVFGEGMVVESVGEKDDFLVVTASAAEKQPKVMLAASLEKTLTITDGLYRTKFAGGVEITGGNFAEDPSAFIPEGFAIGQQKEDGYPYSVIEHEHDFTYEAKGNVITVTCEGEDENADECFYKNNAVTLTLVADDAKEAVDGSAYAGARLDIHDAFVFATEEVTDADIKYYQDSTPLGSAPSAVGEYEARITVEGNTLKKSFRILTRARSFDVTKIKVTGAGDDKCYELAGTTLTVTNGGWKYYSAEEAPDGSKIEGWYAGLTVTWPNEEFNLGGYNFTGPEYAKFTVNGIKGEDEQKRIFTGVDEIPGVSVKTEGFNLFSIELKQIGSFTWYERITVQDVKQASAASQDTIERQVTAWGEKWKKHAGGEYIGRDYGDTDGVSNTTFKIVADLKDLTLVDGDGYTVWPEHEHEWDYEADENSITAKCTIVEGPCRYSGYPVWAKIVPTAEAEKLCDATPLTARVDNGVTFAGATDATVGEVEYWQGGTKLDAAPTQPGVYTAKAVVTLKDGTTTYELKTTLTIRAGQVVVDGQHYEKAESQLEKNVLQGFNADMEIFLGKSFGASRTYNIPLAQITLPLVGEVGLLKTLDLAGFTVTGAVNAAVIDNSGKLTICDSSAAETGTLMADPASDPATPLIINERGATLTIDGGTYLGAISNRQGKVIIISGKFLYEPDAGWLDDGSYVRQETVGDRQLYVVRGHEHSYTFLQVPLINTILSATCTARDEGQGILEGSSCKAKEVVMAISMASKDYDGKSVVQSDAITEWLSGKIPGLSGLVELFQGNIHYYNVTAALGNLNITEFIRKIASGESIFEDIETLGGAILTREQYQKLTGAEVRDIYFTQEPDGSWFSQLLGLSKETRLVEPPVNAGTYNFCVEVEAKRLIGTSERIYTLKKQFKINARPIADTTIELTPNSTDLVYTGHDQSYGITVKTPSAWGIIDIFGLGKTTLVAGEDYTISGTTNATAVGSYSFTVTGIGNYTGTKTVNWQISAPTREFGGNPAAPTASERGDYATADGTVVTVNNSSNLTYDASADAWNLGLVVTWPDGNNKHTVPADAWVKLSTQEGKTYTGADILGGQTDGEDLTLAKTGSDYVKSVTWNVQITTNDVEAAIAAGETEIVVTLTAGANASKTDPQGVKETEFKLVVPIAGILLYDNEGNRVYPDHLHAWEYEPDEEGAALVATCVSTEPGCTIPAEGVKVSIAEAGPFEYDGEAKTMSVANADAFVLATGATVGEIVYLQGGEVVDAAILTGVYTAKVEVVTVEDGVKTLVREFEIVEPSGGYTSGYEIERTGVCYATFAEAVAQAEARDTIVCYGNIDARAFDFTTDKDVTLDLNSKTLTRTDLALVGDNSMTISNDGPGTLTIINGTIQQPKGTVVVGNINIAGNGPIVFGEDVVLDNLAALGAILADYLKVNVSGGGVTIAAGSYEAIFSGNVTIIGGQFWSNFDPSAFLPAEGYMVVEQTGTYKYKVINHTHDYAFESEGLTIRRVCNGTGDDLCPDTVEFSATLAIDDVIAYDGNPVAAAVAVVGTLEYEIAYYQGPTPLDSAPSEIGEYRVEMTIGGTSVGKSFKIVNPGVRLYPMGDNGAFAAPEKALQYLGTVISSNGVEGTVTVKLSKKNKKTGLFNISATVKTLVDKQTYSFKTNKVAVVSSNEVLTVTLFGTNAKSRQHTLELTFDGNSVTGFFDGYKAIDSARYVFSTKNDPMRNAVTNFVGTWTGAFDGMWDEAKVPGTTNQIRTTFSAKLTSKGAATVKVRMPNRKLLSYSTKAEVGEGGIVVVPVMVWQTVSGGKRSFAFRLVFHMYDGEARCEAVDISPVQDRMKKTGEITTVAELEFVGAGRLVQTVTAKDFKANYDVDVSELEERIEEVCFNEKLPSERKVSIKLTASSGVISGTVKWTGGQILVNGAAKKKTFTGKLNGYLIGEVGYGTITVKIGSVTETYNFTAYRKD